MSYKSIDNSGPNLPFTPLNGILSVNSGAIETRSITPFSISRGLYDNIEEIVKFGRVTAPSTLAYSPVSFGVAYQTPQVAGATTLRVKAGNIADAPAGAGARSVTLYGLDVNGDAISETIATGGAAPGPSSVNTFLRLHRVVVETSGTYADAAVGSHVGNIVVENSAGTQDWAVIDSTNYPRGQSEIACFSVPRNKRVFIDDIILEVESTKSASFILFKRENILETVAPYTAARALATFAGVTGLSSITTTSYINDIEGPADIGFLVIPGINNTVVSVDFHINLVDA